MNPRIIIEESQLFTIIQWNSRSIIDKREELLEFMEDKYVDCILLSETWLKGNQTFILPDFTSYVLNRDGSQDGGGVAVLIRKKYASQIINLNTSIETVAVQVILKDITLNICSIYVTDKDKRKPKSDDFKALFRQIPQPCIYDGDLSAHHTSWGSHSIDTRANNLLDAMHEHDLIFLNTGEITRIAAPPKRNSAIDLTLSSSSIALNMNWQTLSNPGTSDHIPIVIIYKQPTSFESNSTQKGSALLANVNWTKFYIFMEKECNKTVFPTSIQTYFTNFMAIISAALSASKNEITPRFTPYWWNEHCRDAINNKKVAFITFRRLSTKESFLNYKKLAAIAKRMLKKTKSEAWDKIPIAVYTNFGKWLVISNHIH